MSNLLIVAGLPGSGKSSWAKSLFDLKYTIVSSDVIRLEEYQSLLAAHPDDPEQRKVANTNVFRIFNERIVNCLAHGIDVIADATSLTVSARAGLRDLADSVPGTEIHLVVFTNIDEAIDRNKQREPDSIVPGSVMAHFHDCLNNTLKELVEGEETYYDSVTYVDSYR